MDIDIEQVATMKDMGTLTPPINKHIGFSQTTVDTRPSKTSQHVDEETQQLKIENEKLRQERQKLLEELEQVKLALEKEQSAHRKTSYSLCIMEDALRGVRTITAEALSHQERNDWSNHLQDFLKCCKKGTGVKDTTYQNYSYWLGPWVDYVSDRGSFISSQLIKEYLEAKYSKSYESYKRVGKAIVFFTNRYQNTEVRLIKKPGIEAKHHCAMSKGNIKKLKCHIKLKIQDLFARKKRTLKEETMMAKYLAILLLVYTGCRPVEAAYIVSKDTYEQNMVPASHKQCNWIVTVP